MQDKNRKFPLSAYEIVLLIIMIPAVFYCWTRLFWYPKFGSFLRMLNSALPEKLLSPWGPSVIISLNILWLIAMYFLPFKNPRIKIYTTLLFLTVSGATLIFWITANAFGGAMH
ncbi:MAG: hypothetical protein WBC22_09090 [Sedimentisphaerales bacterium]